MTLHVVDVLFPCHDQTRQSNILLTTVELEKPGNKANSYQWASGLLFEFQHITSMDTD